MVLRMIVGLALLHCSVGCCQLALTPGRHGETILAVEWRGASDANPADVCVYANGKPIGYGEKGWQRAFEEMRRLPPGSVVLLVYDGASIWGSQDHYLPPYVRLDIADEFAEIVNERKLRIESASWAGVF